MSSEENGVFVSDKSIAVPTFQTRLPSYRMVFVGIPADTRAKFESWRWVAVKDLVSFADDYFYKSGFKMRFHDEGWEILRRFSLLNRPEQHTGDITWVQCNRYALFTQKLPIDKCLYVHIPERWADAITELILQKVIRVSLRESQQGAQERKLYDLEAHFVDGTRKYLHWQGSNSFRLID